MTMNQIYPIFILLLQEILGLYIPKEEIPPEDLNDLIEKSFDGKFDVPHASLSGTKGSISLYEF